MATIGEWAWTLLGVFLGIAVTFSGAEAESLLTVILGLLVFVIALIKLVSLIPCC